MQSGSVELWVDEELAQERVQAGVKFLDMRLGPDWPNKIDPEKLRMGDSALCVLGQMYGSYSTGIAELGLLNPIDCGQLGFLVDGCEEISYRYLNAAWTEAILKRQSFPGKAA